VLQEAVMKGTMMQSPLTMVSLFERAGKLFPEAEVISRRPDSSTHRYRYADWYLRARALAAALQDRGIKPGDRVATLMWNHYIHLEAYFAVPVIGGVLHTLNLRLHPDELTYIVNHAEASATEHASSLSGCTLRRHSSAIRTGCANERSSGSEEGVVSNHDPYSDHHLRRFRDERGIG
jgi:acyl-CoA synthetase (AMP-forming)/AMP-acid ligase II